MAMFLCKSIFFFVTLKDLFILIFVFPLIYNEHILKEIHPHHHRRIKSLTLQQQRTETI